MKRSSPRKAPLLTLRHALAAQAQHSGIYLRTLAKWLFCALLTGGVCGLLGTAFHYSIRYATGLRADHGWLLYLLPLAGLVIVALYRLCGIAHDEGTNLVLNSIRTQNEIPLKMTPLIFIGTVLTHLCGGSAGREGAALQIGGRIGTAMGRLVRLDEKDLHIITIAGMSALFAALFGTPVTAAVFSMEVISVGIVYYAAFFPSVVAAAVASQIAQGFGIARAVVSILFIASLHGAARLYRRLFQNPYLRIAAGGCLVILATLLCGVPDYNGAGMESIIRAIEGGQAHWYAFLLKILFTALTIGAGFKGGEIVPTFFIGATFGCALGPVLGLDAGFAAAVGLVALFCAVVNCPLAALALAIELFGGGGLLLFAAACAVSYLLSGYYSLYSGQHIIYSKLRAEYINRTTH